MAGLHSRYPSQEPYVDGSVRPMGRRLPAADEQPPQPYLQPLIPSSMERAVLGSVDSVPAELLRRGATATPLQAPRRRPRHPVRRTSPCEPARRHASLWRGQAARQRCRLHPSVLVKRSCRLRLGATWISQEPALSLPDRNIWEAPQRLGPLPARSHQRFQHPPRSPASITDASRRNGRFETLSDAESDPRPHRSPQGQNTS